MKYLLDLNYTLVANSPRRGDKPIRPFYTQVEKEEYREWLIDMLRPHTVILITARPEKYREQTLERIKEKTGWQPTDAYFAEIQAMPQFIKKHSLENYIFPKYGKDDYFGLESNPHTRAMYREFGIPAVRVTDEGITKM